MIAHTFAPRPKMKHHTKAIGRPAVLLGCVILVFSGCSGGSDRNAEQLHGEASIAMDQCRKKSKSYSEAWASYREAENRIGRILSEHPTSRVAVGLSSGDTLIAGLTLDQFRKLEESLKELSEAEQSPLACALLLAKKIEPGSERSKSLAHVAGRFAEAGDKERALQLLAQALDVATTNNRPDLPLLCAIAGKYAEFGQQEQALRILSQAQTDALTIVWKYDGAVMNCRDALADVAITYARIGDFGRAQGALDLIGQRNVSRSKAYAGMAGEYAEAGDFSQASRMADMIEGSANDEEEATQALPLAREAANKINGSYSYKKLRALARIGRTHAQLDSMEEASESLLEALNIATGVFSDSSKYRALVFIAEQHGELGQQQHASRLLRHAHGVATGVEDRNLNSDLLRALSGKCVAVGDLAQALEIADAIHEPADQSTALALIAAAHAKSGRGDMAEGLLSRALETTMKIKRGKDRARVLFEMACGLSEIDHREQALEILSKTLDAASTYQLAEMGQPT